MPAETCPRCDCKKFWKVRRQRRRCSRCLYEWRPGPPLRLTREEWTKLLSAYLGESNQKGMTKAIGLHQQRIRRAIRLVQSRMAQSLFNIFPYTSSYPQSGGRSRTARDSRVEVLGVLGQGGQVWAQVVGKGDAIGLLPTIRREIHRGNVVCSDLYQWTRNGANHSDQSVSHLGLLNGNGDVKRAGNGALHGLDGFWKWLEKNRSHSGRKVKVQQLPLYLSECVWKYNHRALPIKQRVSRLMKLISQGQGN